MMKLEDLVPDYETCEKLKAAGYPQNTPLAYYSPDEMYPCTLWHLLKHQGDTRTIAAPTSAEIFKRLLPITPPLQHCDIRLQHVFGAQLENVTIRYVDSTPDLYHVLHLVSNDNLAQAAAEMWLWVLENYPESMNP